MEKIIIAGIGEGYFYGFTYDFEMVRLNTNGSIDSSFGNNGIVITDFGESSSFIYQTIVYPNGKILVGGFKDTTTTDIFTRMTLAQYKPNGILDSSFGINGISDIPTSYIQTFGHSMALTSQNKILFAGRVCFDQNCFNSGVAVARWLNNGKVDSTFGTNGFLFVNAINSSDRGWDIAVQTDDKIVLSSFDYNSGINALIRLQANGLFDSTFGVNGKIIIAGQSRYPTVNLMSNGKLLVTTENPYVNGQLGNFNLNEYNNDGTINTAFGNNGTVETVLPLISDNGPALIQIDGKILVAGTVTLNSKSNFVIVRYTATTLPLHLLTFTAKRANTANLLNWTTAQEVNTDRFEIERSSNGREFSKIGTVKSRQSYLQFYRR